MNKEHNITESQKISKYHCKDRYGGVTEDQPVLISYVMGI